MSVFRASSIALPHLLLGPVGVFLGVWNIFTARRYFNLVLCYLGIQVWKKSRLRDTQETPQRGDSQGIKLFRCLFLRTSTFGKGSRFPFFDILLPMVRIWNALHLPYLHNRSLIRPASGLARAISRVRAFPDGCMVRSRIAPFYSDGFGRCLRWVFRAVADGAVFPDLDFVDFAISVSQTGV